MRRKYGFLAGALTAALIAYSCSLPTLPKRIEARGNLSHYDVPVNIPPLDVGKMIISMLTEDNVNSSMKIWDVSHPRQAEQKFLIRITRALSKSLNPGTYLKAVGEKLNHSMPGTPIPLPIEFDFVPPGTPPSPVPINIPASVLADAFENIIPALPLDAVAQYVQKIHFNGYTADASEGIGLKFTFTQVVPGLRIFLACDELSIERGAGRPLEEGVIVFGNTGNLDLDLAEYKDGPGKKELNFRMELVPANGSTLTINPGDPLSIIGEVEFFQNWRVAEVDVHAAMDKDPSTGSLFEDGKFSGRTPEGNSKMDLSELGKYLRGFEFDRIEAKVYLSGPTNPGTETILSGMHLGLYAESEHAEFGNKKELKLYEGDLKMGRPVINLEGNTYSSADLPGGGMLMENMAELINTHPDDLYLDYEMTLPDILVVNSGMFLEGPDGNGEGDAMTLDIVLMLPLKLTAGEHVGTISLGDLIEYDKDLFGRTKEGDRIDFIDIKTISLHVSVVFSGEFFSGGTIKLFGEEDPLFPDGISLKGRSLGASVSGAVLSDLIGTDPQKAQLLIPDLLVTFAPGSTITIPKNVKISSIRFRISGNYTIDANIEGLVKGDK